MSDRPASTLPAQPSALATPPVEAAATALRGLAGSLLCSTDGGPATDPFVVIDDVPVHECPFCLEDRGFCYCDHNALAAQALAELLAGDAR